MKVDDFVLRFNKHRRLYFSPCDRICVDESISRWYGQGGSWINHGAEIQNAACGRSGIMLRLKLVTTIEYETGKRLLPHGTEIVKELVLPWAHSDQFFARTVILRLSSQPKSCSDLVSDSLV
jgi:hypothetical protein